MNPRPSFRGSLRQGIRPRLSKEIAGVQATIMGRWGKCIVISAVLVIAGSVLVPVAFLVRYASKSGAVRAEIARIKDEGNPVSESDLAGKPIPSSENAAVVYENALRYLDTEPARRDQGLMRGFFDPYQGTRDRESWKQLKDVVSRNSRVLELARRAAAMPKCRFTSQTGRSHDYVGRRYGFIRSLPRLAWAEAVVRAKEGRMDRALESVELVFLMGESMRADRTSGAIRSRYGIIGTGTDALLDVARLGRIDEPAARRLADRLARIDLRDSAVRYLESERVSGIAKFDEMRRGGVRSGYTQTDSDSPSDKAHGILPSGWVLNSDEICYLHDIGKQIEIANRPYSKIKPAKKLNANLPRYSLYAPVTATMGVCAALARDQAIARLDGDRILLGLMAYRGRFGSYPVSLDQLHSKLNWTVPLDPFSGKAFIYRRQGSSFVLYSIGGDLKDNNGTPWGASQGGYSWRRGGVVQNPDEPGDYVWKL